MSSQTLYRFADLLVATRCSAGERWRKTLRRNLWCFCVSHLCDPEDRGLWCSPIGFEESVLHCQISVLQAWSNLNLRWSKVVSWCLAAQRPLQRQEKVTRMVRCRKIYGDPCGWITQSYGMLCDTSSTFLIRALKWFTVDAMESLHKHHFALMPSRYVSFSGAMILDPNDC